MKLIMLAALSLIFSNSVFARSPVEKPVLNAETNRVKGGNAGGDKPEAVKKTTDDKTRAASQHGSGQTTTDHEQQTSLYSRVFNSAINNALSPAQPGDTFAPLQGPLKMSSNKINQAKPGC